MDYQQLITFMMEMVGTVAFAASGAMVAVDRAMDIFGVIVLGVTTAVGGGAVRDVILGIVPPAMCNFENFLSCGVFNSGTIIKNFIYSSSGYIGQCGNFFNCYGHTCTPSIKKYCILSSAFLPKWQSEKYPLHR